ncbi:hypothetical protein TTHT_1487 [Thermotomaculum hydrothermale]|uniref:Tetratricopeptide repeat protein n=1 Tax=Thermotomaculum hydrothermale TaxID=981385 RepID=A0A7R6PNR0_9BACT|nr:hypothetical protein [Thermotomaculum hydrothermale]BBB32993.1 hypothetical protein TTHT_1487 [Thermotomaculum hydrothermale]
MAVKLFEEGLSLLAKKDYKKAMEKFNKTVEQTDNLQLVAKCKSFINLCKEKIKETEKKNEEIDYGYAVYLINNGKFEESKEILEETFKKKKDKTDTYYYLYAIAEAGSNNHVNAKKYLQKAISHNPSIIHLALKEPLLKDIAVKIAEK